ncbi:MAG: PAS domain-containing protein, partial [Methylococcales bacterium]|nr:PAS domain-containing protein [Methylococcales bacterium]
MIDLFDIKDLIPHGYCLLWSPVLLWLHVISDLLITLAYYSIPVTLIYFIRHRKDFPYPWLVTLFAGFIVACGTTHLLSVITIWIPLYWLDGLLKAFTAIISLATAVLMLWLIPRALSLPSAAQLEAEIQQRNIAQMAQQEAFNRLNKIASRVPGLVYQYRLRPDGSHSLPYASESIRTLFRLKPEEVSEDATKIFALLHPDDAVSVWTSIHKSAQDLALWSHEFRVKLDDGSVRWLSGSSLPEREPNGDILWHGFMTDITERKQMEEKLRD